MGLEAPLCVLLLCKHVHRKHVPCSFGYVWYAGERVYGAYGRVRGKLERGDWARRHLQGNEQLF
jgi:hypothetical protein